MRVGMIGAGGIARTHAANLRQIDGVEIAAVMDPLQERAETLAAECGARAFADLEPLLHDVDAVYVCSPPTFHRAQVEAAAAAGKHVYLEKPIATTLADGRAIAATLASSPARSMVGFNNRFRPVFRRWRDLAAELGPPRSAWILRMAPSLPAPNANWRTTPGLLCGITIESASHDIDLVRWALGEVGTVAGTTSSVLPELEGFDDTLSAVLRLEGGPAVTLAVSWSSALSTSSRGFVGSGGAAELVGPDMWTVTELRWASTGEPEMIEPIDTVEGADLGYRAASEHFIACLREDREPEVTVRDGLAALEVSLALKRWAASGRAIACDRSPAVT
ncbi:MAG TPA: Gfo/Idh/MocA family oxidoreductase [Actinomycetota bacterium]|nr:Gfo/Idh/MocA family oxidoreductase [Actinomycetota bacterium]